MMKNKKLIIVFMLVITFLALMVTFTKAADNDNEVGQLPTIDSGNNPSNQNSPTTNTPAPITNNNVEPVTNNSTNGTSQNTLPQTGVAGDTALFVFIGVCVVSAVYAYFRIRKYNNIH